MRRSRGGRFRPAALATALAAVITGGAAPATAVSPDQCPPAHFCVWEHNDYTGRFFSSSGSSPNIGAAMNDRTSSYRNRSRWWVSMYLDADYGGGCIMQSIGPGGASWMLPADINDRMTSFVIASSPLC
ncbi:peptidase inhibitor family I36 protein [Streptomyces yaizuensis]|uniref:Peptidase inhibitor family I36 protein n=1 Tax=Streptomyces yaizuensis TaxID=2989713 RepID=A0ABQ5PB98_9ACTN|nr:peptidase inhibitor family I36 protein [Streptomyces sp. YSPA8]GLF99859.1 peptidase inhibitor family I36 protein [Streptomyces sp. YSPA8]